MKRLVSIFCILGILVTLFSGFSVTVPAQEVTAVTLGNPNGGELNAGDALTVLRYLVGKQELSALAVSACDVDCSDEVNAKDALQILQHLVGVLPAFAPTGLGGRTLVIGTQYPGRYNDDTATGRAMLSAIQQVESQYGVEILVETINYDLLDYYDIVELPVHDARKYAKKGVLKNLNTNAVVDTSVLNGASTDACRMGDMLCGVASKAMSANAMGLAMNGDLLKQYAPQSYAKLETQFETGKWTWAALDALMAEYRENKPGAALMISNTNIIGQAIVANAGYEVTFLEDGSGAVCSIASKEGIEALQYIKGLLNDGLWTYQADMKAAFDSFKRGRVPMMVYYLSEAAAYQGNFEMTAMPFPVKEEGMDYVMSTFNSATFALPKGSEEYGNGSAAVLSALAAANADLTVAAAEDAAAMGYDTLGAKVFTWAAEHTTADFSAGPFTAAVGGPVDSSVLDASKDPAVVLPSVAELIQQEVDTYYGQFYKK